jgi:hypothetical protein
MRKALGLFWFSWGGCILAPITGASGGAWYDVGPIRKPLAEINGAAYETLYKQGYSLPEYDAQNPRQETQWEVHLSNSWQEGYRTKVEYVCEGSPPGAYTVWIRSYREYNNNALSPLTLDQASWTSAGLNDRHKDKIDDPALRLRTNLRAKFFGINND